MDLTHPVCCRLAMSCAELAASPLAIPTVSIAALLDPLISYFSRLCRFLARFHYFGADGLGCAGAAGSKNGAGNSGPGGALSAATGWTTLGVTTMRSPFLLL